MAMKQHFMGGGILVTFLPRLHGTNLVDFVTDLLPTMIPHDRQAALTAIKEYKATAAAPQDNEAKQGGAGSN